MTDFTYIDSEYKLDPFIDLLKKAESVVLDTEGSSLYSYQDKLCLMQLSVESKGEYGLFILDPLVNLNLNEVFEIMAMKKIIVHGSDYDLRILYQDNGFIPKNEIFDTLLAGHLLGLETLSLVSLVRSFCGIDLSKSSQKSDWSKRPLSEKQIEYAVNDVRFLNYIKMRLEEMLIEKSRLSWHKEWCQKVSTNGKNMGSNKDRWRISGSSLLQSKGLHYLKSIWSWRELESEKYDCPSFRIMRNEKMLSLAKFCVTYCDKIKKKQFILPRCNRIVDVRTLMLAIDDAVKVPSKDWPKENNFQKKQRRYINKEIFTVIKSDINVLAKTLSIQPCIILSNALLTNIVKCFPEVSWQEALNGSDIMVWQKELVFDIFKRRCQV